MTAEHHANPKPVYGCVYLYDQELRIFLRLNLVWTLASSGASVHSYMVHHDDQCGFLPISTCASGLRGFGFMLSMA